MKNFKIVFFIIFFLLNQHCFALYPYTDTSGCVFPFTYEGSSHSQCITGDQNAPWCSYTEDFMGVWKFCKDMRKSDLKCISECELYDNEQYLSCSTNQPGIRKYCVEQILDMSKDSSKIISDDCPNEFKEIPYHTACLNPSIYVAKIGVSDNDKEVIVRVHNEWRKNVPLTASGMTRMYWDEELAYVAQKHAEQCIFAHDDSTLRSIPITGKHAGQNIVVISGKNYYDWEYALNTMYAGESERFEYGVGTKKEFEEYGKSALHYTQIILEKLSKVGCGYAECIYAEKLERFYVCNYDQLQMDYQIPKPYETGPSCQACPDHCYEGKLCDCGGLDCYNGGYLDVTTCTCKCKGMWTGKKCDTPIISTHDEHGCAIPFIYNDQLHYDCAVDKENFPIPFCFSVPEFDNDADHFIACDWMQTKRRYVARNNYEKKSIQSSSQRKLLMEKYHQKLKRKIESPVSSSRFNYFDKKSHNSFTNPFRHVIKKNHIKFNVI